MGLIVYAQSRTPGSDGAYTDQVVIEIEAITLLGWYTIAHDLDRVPDWVRVTCLTFGVLQEGPSPTDEAHLEPAIDLFQCGMGGRLFWDLGEVGNTDGRPITVVDPTQELWFGAEHANRTGIPVKYLVEFGITHSGPK
jgi:hypothetical protein